MLNRKIRQNCRRGSGASSFPELLIEGVCPGGSAPHRTDLPKGLESPPVGASGEARWSGGGSRRRGLRPVAFRSLAPGARFQPHRPQIQRHQADIAPILPSPWDRWRRGWHRTARPLLLLGAPSCADQRLRTAPGASRPVRTGSCGTYCEKLNPELGTWLLLVLFLLVSPCA